MTILVIGCSIAFHYINMPVVSASNDNHRFVILSLSVEHIEIRAW